MAYNNLVRTTTEIEAMEKSPSINPEAMNSRLTEQRKIFNHFLVLRAIRKGQTPPQWAMEQPGPLGQWPQPPTAPPEYKYTRPAQPYPPHSYPSYPPPPDQSYPPPSGQSYPPQPGQSYPGPPPSGLYPSQPPPSGLYPSHPPPPGQSQPPLPGQHPSHPPPPGQHPSYPPPPGQASVMPQAPMQMPIYPPPAAREAWSGNAVVPAAVAVVGRPVHGSTQASASRAKQSALRRVVTFQR